jgi:hypothetical protein
LRKGEVASKIVAPNICSGGLRKCPNSFGTQVIMMAKKKEDKAGDSKKGFGAGTGPATPKKVYAGDLKAALF